MSDEIDWGILDLGYIGFGVYWIGGILDWGYIGLGVYWIWGIYFVATTFERPYMMSISIFDQDLTSNGLSNRGAAEGEARVYLSAYKNIYDDETIYALGFII